MTKFKFTTIFALFALALTLVACPKHTSQEQGRLYGATAVVNTAGPTFVFNPGATTGPGVYTTWAALYAAASIAQGPIWVLVNDNDGANPAHVTVGTYNVQNWTFQGAQRPTTVAGAAQLIFDDGAVFTFNKLRLQFIKFVQNGNNTPVWTAPAGQSRIWLEEQAVLCPTPLVVAAVPWGALPNGATLAMNLVGSTMGDGTHAAIGMVAGSTLSTICRAAGNLTANAVSGGAGSFILSLDDTATVSLTQAPVPSENFLSKAAQDAYTPGTAGNWQPAPTLVSAALDQLAAPNFVQAANNTGTGTGTTTAVTGNIAKLRSGKVRVSGVATGIMTAGGTVTVSLLRDAAPILALPALTYLATSAYSIPINFIDTLPDAANHTYTVQAVASAGNLTVGAGGNLVQATEL